MKLYNYVFQAKHTNATILISVRNDQTEVEANEIALAELANALDTTAESWYVEELEIEEY